MTASTSSTHSRPLSARRRPSTSWRARASANWTRSGSAGRPASTSRSRPNSPCPMTAPAPTSASRSTPSSPLPWPLPSILRDPRQPDPLQPGRLRAVGACRGRRRARGPSGRQERLPHRRPSALGPHRRHHRACACAQVLLDILRAPGTDHAPRPNAARLRRRRTRSSAASKAPCRSSGPDRPVARAARSAAAPPARAPPQAAARPHWPGSGYPVPPEMRRRTAADRGAPPTRQRRNCLLHERRGRK